MCKVAVAGIDLVLTKSNAYTLRHLGLLIARLTVFAKACRVWCRGMIHCNAW